MADTSDSTHDNQLTNWDWEMLQDWRKRPRQPPTEEDERLFSLAARLVDIKREMRELDLLAPDNPVQWKTKREELAKLRIEHDQIRAQLDGTEPDAPAEITANADAGDSATPSPATEPCITFPPQKKDVWYNAMQDAALGYQKTHGKRPNQNQLWAAMHASPPKSYVITSGTHNGEKSLLMPDGAALGKRAFRLRWDRYTGRNKHNKT